MSCLTDKFPFVLQDNSDIQKQSLTLIFFVNVRKLYPLKFMSTSMFLTISLAILIKIMKITSLILISHLDNLVIEPDFKYYQSHEFHKLNQGLTIQVLKNLVHT